MDGEMGPRIHKLFNHRGSKACERIRTLYFPTIPSGKISDCLACAEVKVHRDVIAEHLSDPVIRPLQVVSWDTMGPFSVSSANGNRYVVMLVDHFTSLRWIRGLPSRASKGFIKFFQYLEIYEFTKFRNELDTELSVRQIMSDNAGEFISREICEFFSQREILHSFNAPHTPESRGKVERLLCQVLIDGLVLTRDAGLVPRFYFLWEHAFTYAAQMANITPTESLPGFISPMAKAGFRFSVKDLHIFGCLASVHIPKLQRSKLEVHGDIALFLHRSEHKGGTRTFVFYNLVRSTIQVSRHVKFCEELTIRDYPEVIHIRSKWSSDGGFNCGSRYAEEVLSEWSNQNSDRVEKVVTGDSTSTEQSSIVEVESDEEDSIIPVTVRETITLGQVEDIGVHDNVSENIESFEESGWNVSPIQLVRDGLRPLSGVSYAGLDDSAYSDRENDSDFIPQCLMISDFTELELGEEGQLQSAMDARIIPRLCFITRAKSRDIRLWLEADTKEYNSLMDKGTWEEVPLPDGAVLHRSFVVRTQKVMADGSMVFKSRFVVSDDKSPSDSANYSPVVSKIAFRILLAFGAFYRWEVAHYDFAVAFLNAPVRGEYYVRAFPGRMHFTDSGEPLVYHLNRSLYGLKSSPSQWHSTIRSWMIGLGLKQNTADECLFTALSG
jgi:hypothetical protein